MKKKLIILLVVIGIIITCVLIWKHVTAQQATQTKSPQPQQAYISVKYLEIPCSNEAITEHMAYTLSYNEEFEQANWVAYQLTKSELTGHTERENKFIEDPLIESGSATNKDYYKSGFDKGHLAPAADMKFNQIAMKESFYLSNMSPQAPEFNRGIWKDLEEQVREWALRFDTLYIVTGPILQAGLPTIGSNKVAVPEYYFKAILAYTSKHQQAIGFIMANKKLPSPIFSYAVSIDEIEKKINRDLYCNLPDPIEQKVEKQINVSSW